MTWMRPAPIQLLSSARLREEVAKGGRVLDAGSGGRRLAENVVGTDVARRENVDVVADLCGGLPFNDSAFDLVVCCSVLEHVEDCESAIRELVRVTRPGGSIWIEVPFLYHFHISGEGDVHDFRRWTLEGVKRMTPECRIVDVGHNVAPATALRLIASEALALPFYFSKHTFPYYFVRWLVGWILLPLSLLDGPCSRKPISHRVAGGFWLLLEKP